MNSESHGGDMDHCPHCLGILIGKLMDYYVCLSPECNRLLDHIDPELKKEEERRKSDFYKQQMRFEAH